MLQLEDSLAMLKDWLQFEVMVYTGRSDETLQPLKVVGNRAVVVDS